MASSKGVWGLALFVGLTVASLVRAEEPSVPVRLQAGLLAKLAGYDRNMRARAGDRLQIATLIKAGDTDSVRVGNEMSYALGSFSEIAGLPHDDKSLTYTSPEALIQACTSQHIAILYLAPGLGDEIPQISQALRGVSVLTVSSVAGYVPKGIVIGFDAIGGQPRMLVHLSQARAQNVEFQSTVLKLMKVYE